MSDHADARRKLYLDAVFQMMADGQREWIVERAVRTVALWEQQHARSVYVDRWRELLSEDAETMRRAVMADTDAGAELRHCMPFAGLLSYRQRNSLAQT